MGREEWKGYEGMDGMIWEGRNGRDVKVWIGRQGWNWKGGM